MTKAMTDMAGASLPMYPNEAAAALAEALRETMSAGIERRVWYGYSGYGANDAACRCLH